MFQEVEKSWKQNYTIETQMGEVVSITCNCNFIFPSVFVPKRFLTASTGNVNNL